MSIEEEETVDGRGSLPGTPERLSSSAESDNFGHKVEQPQRTRSQLAAMVAVVEAARNHALPPVPPGWKESIDPYSDEVFYTNIYTGARVRRSYRKLSVCAVSCTSAAV